MLKYGHRVARPYKRALRSGYRDIRRLIRDDFPPWLGHMIDTVLERFDLALVDHGIFRFLYPNRHAVAARAWRSSQPAPHEIALFARRGIRTVINLRGYRDCGSYRLERAACLRHGIELIDFPARSRAAPDPAFFHKAKALFEGVEYPIVMHCKSGADRVGLMSVLYLILAEGRPAEEARRQLSLRYGHIAEADTGILDAVIDSYIAYNSRTPVAFLDWVDTVYDPRALKARFAARTWGNVLVNGILRRE
jgi:protein tyrosine phosphatase (PTP) superfamily phosphohydrolase (DUF442 family)